MNKSPFRIEGSDFTKVWNVFNGKCHVAGPYKTKAAAKLVKDDMDRIARKEATIEAKIHEIHLLEECIKEGGHYEDVDSWRHELSIARGQLEQLMPRSGKR